MKNKYYYIGLNFLVPGLGQLSAKRYGRGIILSLCAIGAVIRLAWEVIMPFIRFYGDDIATEKIPEIKFFSILAPIVFFAIVMLWSIIDMMTGFENRKDEEMS